MPEQNRRPETPEEKFFADLMQTFDGPIHGILRKRFRVPEDDVMDVKHNVWMKVLKHLRKGTPIKRPVEEAWSWLWTVARSAAMDYHRRRASAGALAKNLHQKHSSSDRRWNGWPAREVSTQPSGPVISEAERKAAIEAVEGLDAAGRSAVEARFWEGRPFTEIADDEGIGRKTAERRMAKRLGLLRERLKHLRDDLDP